MIMKILPLLIFLLLPYYCFSQDLFSIHGNGDGLKNVDRIFLQYKIEKRVVNDSVLVMNKKFSFKGKINC